MSESLCYMDGRIIKLALLEKGVNLLSKNMYVTFNERGGDFNNINVEMKYAMFKKGMNLLRVIIQSQYMRHSTMLFIDLNAKKIHYFNPLTLSQAVRYKRLHAIIKTHIRKYLDQWLQGFEFNDVQERVEGFNNPKCNKSGMCNAYVLKYALDCIDGMDFNGSNIEIFANNMIEKYKEKLTEGKEDIEFDFNPEGAAVGGLGGAAVGGLVAGPVGMLAGAGAGALAGGTLFSKERYHHENRNSRDLNRNNYHHDYCGNKNSRSRSEDRNHRYRSDSSERSNSGRNSDRYDSSSNDHFDQVYDPAYGDYHTVYHATGTGPGLGGYHSIGVEPDLGGYHVHEDFVHEDVYPDYDGVLHDHFHDVVYPTPVIHQEVYRYSKNEAKHCSGDVCMKK